MIKIKKNVVSKKNVFYILCLFFTIFLIVFVISVKGILKWQKDSLETKKEIEEQIKETTIIESEDNKNTEIIGSKDNISKEDPYWDYIKIKLIDVDFKELKKKNQDIIGWIQVNGTNINYPFVQTTNNTFYLSHSFDKTYNKAGWIFMDYRNRVKELDKNTILYAHGRSDNTMFGSLKNILKNDWLENPNNFIIKITTETEKTLWQVFSIYKIPTTADYLAIDFLDNHSFLEFTTTLINRSQFDFKTTMNENDKILTLSTCYGNHNKVVLHAKLIKKEPTKDAS